MRGGPVPTEIACRVPTFVHGTGMMQLFFRAVVLLACLVVWAPRAGNAADPLTTAQQEFFEASIRPVLIAQCYACHNSTKVAEGKLALDDRASLLKGGEGGPIIVPGMPGKSRLLAILRHEVKGMEMPQDGNKLDKQTIANFEKWIAMGAPDPRDKPPTAAELNATTDWPATLAKRKQWWSFQPIRAVDPPTVDGNDWSQQPIDRFILAKLRENKLSPAQRADARTLVRRLYFTLTGLPPTADEAELWTARLAQDNGYEQLVDHLLASPHFGEHWARHWMDWTRYAESHGSEGDPTIDGAWHYRDYLIRALNADIPYDQLVREHVAGDLLEQPRMNQDLGINESAIGTSHWRMVFHGFAPTDALDEKVRFVDDQINTFSKAFLGLTVACARCHDHKFDAISQRDYYALFGVLGSCRPGRHAIDSPARLDKNRTQLAELKPKIRTAIADAWLVTTARLPEQLLAGEGPASVKDEEKLLLHSWLRLRQRMRDGATFEDAWKEESTAWQSEREQRLAGAQRSALRQWNLADRKTYARWFRHGGGLPSQPHTAGEFALAPNGDSVLIGIYPAGVYSHTLSAKHPARLSSDNVPLDGDFDLWVLATGEGGASVRYVVHDYPRNGTVYPVTGLNKEWQWLKLDMTYWNGDDIHVELTAGQDAPLLTNKDGRSWFGVREARIVRKGDPGPPSLDREYHDALLAAATSAPPQSAEDLATLYATAIDSAIKAWRDDKLSNAQANLLDTCIKQGLLPNKLGELATAKALVDEYRRLEEEIAIPTRVPGLEETVGRNQRLLERGDHKRPGDEVPRAFLEAIDPTPYKAANSGRRQLAEDVLRADNPLSRRVIANRLWHHALGRGIVGTPDNLGRLGEAPTHPELLDYLATQLSANGWSLKKAIRAIVISETWQMSSKPSAASLAVDADNRLLSHAFVRRLEAESVRDALLVASGSLDRNLFGVPIDGNAARRSVYVRVQRNALDPFLRTFDFPEPFSTTGRRDATNVPAQSLALMNDPRVAALASEWATRVLAKPQLTTDEQRIHSMFLAAFSRPPQATDVERMQTYLAELKSSQRELAAELAVLRRQITERQSAISKIIEPVRTKLLASHKPTAASEVATPKPIAHWDFEDDLKDAIGAAHGVAKQGARLEGGALVVNEQAHVVTEPLKQDLKAKTLEAWVQLANLGQRGGGVMTIQTPDGTFFDSIVFGEQSPQQWLAGSNNFVRTAPFDGAQEKEGVERPVHIAFTYHADGRVIAYRDGQPYGKPIKTNGPYLFEAGKAIVSFGVRHLPAGGNRMLAGKILRANLYDKALSAEEVHATALASPFYVSESTIQAELSVEARDQVAADRKQIAEIEAEIESLGDPVTLDDKALWSSVAHALFTFQEFIYIK